MQPHRWSDICSLKSFFWLIPCVWRSLSPSLPPAPSTSYHSSVHNLYVGSSPCAFTTQICPAEDASVISTSAPCKYTPGKPGAPSLLMRNCCRRCCYLLSLSRGGKAKVSVCCLVKSHQHLIASSSIDSTSTSVLTIPIYDQVPSDFRSPSIAQLSCTCYKNYKASGKIFGSMK